MAHGHSSLLTALRTARGELDLASQCGMPKDDRAVAERLVAQIDREILRIEQVSAHMQRATGYLNPDEK